MRIHVVGSHSVGKTTIARHVAKRYGLPQLVETARSVLAEREIGFAELRSSIERSNEYQRAVLRRQIDYERAQPNGFVSDRAMDNLAYCAEHATCLHDMLRGETRNDLEEYMHEVARGVVIFARPHRDLLREDGVREGGRVDWDGVVRVDGMIKFILEYWAVPYVQVSTPIWQERVRLVEYVLDARRREEDLERKLAEVSRWWDQTISNDARSR